MQNYIITDVLSTSAHYPTRHNLIGTVVEATEVSHHASDSWTTPRITYVEGTILSPAIPNGPAGYRSGEKVCVYGCTIEPVDDAALDFGKCTPVAGAKECSDVCRPVCGPRG